MKKILIIILVCLSVVVKAQYNPTNFTVSNKSYGMSQAGSTDARSMFYDAGTFTMRNYASRAEILAYLNLAKYRAGKFPIYLDSASRTYVLFFRDGTADANLVYWNTDAAASTQWQLTGNSGIVDGTNYLGTLNNAPLSFKVNNFPSGRIDNTNANTFFGYRSGGLVSSSNNTAIGYGSMLSNSSGGGNTSIGTQSMFNSTFGNNNTSVGYSALSNNTTGSSNTVLGYNTGLGLSTGSYNTIIGANVTGLTAALSNNIIIADGQGNKRFTVDDAGTSVLVSTTALGLPSGNTAQRPSSPVAGYTRWNTDSTAKETYNGSAWVKDGSGSGGSGVTNVATGFGLSGGPITSTGTVVFDSAAGGTGSGFHTQGSTDARYYLRSNPSGFITGNQSITLGGDVSGSGTTSITTTLASIITAGSCTNCNLTYDAKGRLTVAANGSGGTGGFNSNVGSAYRWAIPNTNNVKTYAVGYGLLNDSATTNQLKTTLDSATVYNYVRSLINASDSITVINLGATGEQFVRPGHDTLFINKLRAGTNVTLTRASDSAIVIDATGAGGITNVFKQTDSLMKNTNTFWGRDSVIEGIVKKPVVIATPANIRSDAASLIVLPDHSWMIAYTAYATSSADAGSAVIAVRRSTDYGATWSAVDTAVFNTANGNYIPSLYLRNDGTVLMLYDYQPTPTTSQIRKVTLASPYTVGTWSAPALAFGSGSDYYAPGGDRILKTHNGILLYPYNINTTPGDLSSQTGNYRGRLLVSYNDGTSWTNVSTFNNGSPDSLCVEAGLYQIDDTGGTIYYYYRTRSNDVYAVKANGSDTTFDQTHQIALGIGAPNTLTSIKYSPQHKTAIAIHNSLDENFDRMQMYMSTSQDNLTWTRVVRLDSLTGYKYFEPFLTFINNEIVAGYSRADIATGDTCNLYTNRIPYQYIQSGTPYQNTFNSLVVDAGNLVENPNLLEMYYRTIPRANAYVKVQNITQGYSFGAAWFRIKNSAQPVLWDNNVATNTDAFKQNAFWGTSTNVGDAYVLHEWQNNSTAKARIFGNGNGYFAGTLTAAATDSVGTPINSLWMDAGGTIHKGVSAAGGLSGTTNRIVKFTSSTSGGNSTASDDGTFFTIPNANIGSGTADGGWELQVQGASNTNIRFKNVENNNHTNIFRAEKQRTAGSFILNTGDPVFNFDGQGGVGSLRMEANSVLASDNYTNLDLVWYGRETTTLAERMRVTGEGRFVLAKKSDGASANMFSMTLSDIGHTSAYFDIDNISTGGSVFAPWFKVKSSGTGYGALWDINTTGANGAFVVDARNGGSAISAGNDLFLLSNNSSTIFNMHADGKSFFKDTISSVARGGYTTNINSTLGLYSWPTKRYVDSLVGTVGGAPTLQSVLTAGPNISSNTTSTFGSTSWTLSQNSTGRFKLSSLKQDAVQFLTGHGADSSLINVTAPTALAFLGINQGFYTPTLNNTTNITTSSADSCYWTAQGNIVTVFFSVTVTTTLAAASELGIDLPSPYVGNIFSVNLLHGSGSANAAIATNITLEGDVGNNRAKLSFTGLAVSGNGKIKGSFSYIYISP